MSTPLLAAPAAEQRPGPRRSGADRLRGLLALLTLLTLLLGVPAALIALRGNPLPHAVTDVATLTDRLTRPDDGTLFLAALTWVAWFGWSSFALSVLVEIPAQLRGLPSPRLPALGLQQHAAGTLVAGATLLFTVPLTALHSPALATTTPHPVAAASPIASVTQPAATSTTTAPTEAATSGVRTVPDAPAGHGSAARYVVQPGDSLWQIASDVLGDGTRYLEIARLNYDQPQPDGLRLTADHWLRPGWTLTLPADASARLSAGVADTVVVQPGDTLWGIAERTLGDGHRYDEIAAASTGPQADGSRLTDPNRIRPGWRLTVPQTSGAAAPSPVGQPAAGTAPSAAPTADDEALLSADGHGGDVETPAGAARPAPDAERIEQSSDQTVGEPASEQEESPAAVRTTAGIGALLAAGLLTILGARRARQQRRRKPGQRIPMPINEVASAETELRVVQDPDATVRVDRALRTLSARLREAHQVLPPLQLVRIEGQQLELHLAKPADLPAPFVGTTDPMRWVLAADSALLPVEDLAEVPAPYPTLVTLGHDLHGAHLLVNLEHIGILTLEGDDPSGTAVLAALAAELGISFFADDLQVTLVGFLPELPGALNTGRVRHVDTLEEVLPTLERRASERRTDPINFEQQAASPPQVVGPSLDSGAPEILLSAGPLSEPAQRRLEAVVNQLPQAAAVLTGASTSGRWTLRLDGLDGLALLAPVNMTVRPQRLTDADLRQLFELLELADAPSQITGTSGSVAPDEPTLALLEAHRPAGVAEGRLPLQAVPAPSGDEPAEPEAAEGDVLPSTTPPGGRTTSPESFDPAPVIRLLGPVEIQHARGGVEPSKRRQLTEIAAFLALHPGGDHHGLSEAIWPGARAVDNTRNTALSKLRRWLGTDADGNDFVPRVVEDGYRLHPAVRTDWQLWRELMPDGPAAASTPTLAAALDLVQGKPFAGTNPRRYAWAERDRQDMISAIVDVAHELACRALLDGNAPLARRAAAAGLQADPGAELLWRDALKAEWLAGDLEGLTETADRLTVLTEELGDDLEQETVELLEELLRRPARQARAR